MSELKLQQKPEPFLARLILLIKIEITHIR